MDYELCITSDEGWVLVRRGFGKLPVLKCQGCGKKPSKHLYNLIVMTSDYSVVAAACSIRCAERALRIAFPR